MNIKNIIILRDLQYFILIALVFFAIFSLIIKNINKKFILLFLFILFSQIFVFTLYYGELFFIFIIPITLFFLVLYLLNLQINKDFYHKNLINFEINDKNDKENLNKEDKLKSKIIFTLIYPILFCGGFIFLFLKFSNNYTSKFNLEKNISLIKFTQIATEIYSNYAVIIFIIIFLIFILFIWIISIILNKRKS